MNNESMFSIPITKAELEVIEVLRSIKAYDRVEIAANQNNKMWTILIKTQRKRIVQVQEERDLTT